MESIQALAADFEAKQARVKAILADEGCTAEMVLEAEGLNAECRTLSERMQAIRRVDAVRAQSEGLENWASALQPLQGAPGIPPGTGTHGNGVNVLGLQYDGEMVINPTRKGVEVENLTKDGKADDAFRAGAFAKAAEDDYKAAWRRSIREPWGNLSNAEQAALQVGQDSAGGFLAPDELLNRLIERKPTPTRLGGRVMRLTTSKPALLMPKVNYSTDDLYTTGIRVTWTGEQAASATAHRVTEPVFGQVSIPVYTAMMSIPVTQDLLEDSTIDLMAWLSMKFGETIELLRDNMILNGSGVGQPTGILTNVDGANGVSSVVSGAAAELTGDGLIDLTEALPEQYDENAVVVFNKTNTGKAIRKLKDGDGRPLFNYGAQDNGYGGPRGRDINGYPYIWSGFAPNIGANAYPIVFGDLNGYCAVDRLGFSIRALFELYAETNLVVLLARVRFGGVTLEPWRLRVQKVAAS